LKITSVCVFEALEVAEFGEVGHGHVHLAALSHRIRLNWDLRAAFFKKKTLNSEIMSFLPIH
jgi:hypothetical protein